MGIENELSQICAMIESGKLCYADAVYYLNLMRKKYGIWEKEFRQICDVWSQKGELSGELDRHRDRAEDEADGLYQRVLDGLYEMVELGEITLEMMAENLWEDAYMRSDFGDFPCSSTHHPLPVLYISSFSQWAPPVIFSPFSSSLETIGTVIVTVVPSPA